MRTDKQITAQFAAYSTDQLNAMVAVLKAQAADKTEHVVFRAASTTQADRIQRALALRNSTEG